MIRIEIDSQTHSEQIILCPNLSPNWRANQYLLYLVATLALGIAIGFALQGAWLILPFAGLEVIALFSLVYLVAHRCQCMEVIHIREEEVVVEQGRNAPDKVWRSQRFFTRLQIVKSGHPWYPNKVVLRGRESEVEVGVFLNDNEKQRLIAQLRHALNTG